MIRVIAIAAAVVLSTISLAEGLPQDNKTKDKTGNKSINTDFIDNKGNRTGSAKLTETANGLLIEADLRNLEPGWHGFHLHEVGDCSQPDFKSAGGHYHPKGAQHGFLIKDGPHAGDLPNVHVGADGTVKFQAFADGVKLHAPLIDDNGAAIVVHSGADDYRSQPSGDSGKRIACAEIG